MPPMPNPSRPLTARALCAAQERAGRRSAATHDALSRAACYEAQADDYAREARACRQEAGRAASPSDRVRLAACAATLDRSADEYRAKAAAELAGAARARWVA